MILSILSLELEIDATGYYASEVEVFGFNVSADPIAGMYIIPIQYDGLHASPPHKLAC